MKNTFPIKLSDNCIFELKIESPLTILTGDSGTGKTMLFKVLAAITTNHLQSYVEGINVEDILVCLNERELANVLNREYKFIFIDKYDIFTPTGKVLLNDSMLKYKNNWIIASRTMDLPNLGLLSRGIKEIKRRRSNGVWRLYLENYKP